MKIKINNLSLEVHKCNFFERISGLMFTRREKAKALLFDFEKPVKISIHSLFVFFPFIAVWLNDKNEVLKIEKVSSWKLNISLDKLFNKLVEIPINEKYDGVIRLLDGVRKV